MNVKRIGRETSKGWQENRKVKSYIPELEEFFTVTPHNGIFLCTL